MCEGYCAETALDRRQAVLFNLVVDKRSQCIRARWQPGSALRGHQPIKVRRSAVYSPSAATARRISSSGSLAEWLRQSIVMMSAFVGAMIRQFGRVSRGTGARRLGCGQLLLLPLRRRIGFLALYRARNNAT